MKSQKSIGDTGVISRRRNTCSYCLLPYSEKQMRTKWRSSRLLLSGSVEAGPGHTDSFMFRC